jgi:hypothetical protein
MSLQMSSGILPGLMGSLYWISWELKVNVAPDRVKEEEVSDLGS